MKSRKEVNILKLYERLFPQNHSIRGFETKNLGNLTLNELIQLKADCRAERLLAIKNLREIEKKQSNRKPTRKLTTLQKLRSDADNVILEIAVNDLRTQLRKYNEVDSALDKKIRSIGGTTRHSSSNRRYAPNLKYQDEHHERFQQLWDQENSQERAYDLLAKEYPEVIVDTHFGGYIVQFRKYRKTKSRGKTPKYRK
jgi:hypothetical protein